MTLHARDNTTTNSYIPPDNDRTQQQAAPSVRIPSRLVEANTHHQSPCPRGACMRCAPLAMAPIGIERKRNLQRLRNIQPNQQNLQVNPSTSSSRRQPRTKLNPLRKQNKTPPRRLARLLHTLHWRRLRARRHGVDGALGGAHKAAQPAGRGRRLDEWRHGREG